MAVADGGSFCPPKQWTLTENESITSYANWQSNIEYHLSLNNEFATFLAAVWSKKSVTNRGLVDDPAGDQRKTAVQKNLLLERMLGLVAQFAPSLLRNDIIKKSTSLVWIWTRIRKHDSFSKSEANFLKLYTSKTFVSRLVSHFFFSYVSFGLDKTFNFMFQISNSFFIVDNSLICVLNLFISVNSGFTYLFFFFWRKHL